MALQIELFNKPRFVCCLRPCLHLVTNLPLCSVLISGTATSAPNQEEVGSQQPRTRGRPFYSDQPKVRDPTYIHAHMFVLFPDLSELWYPFQTKGEKAISPVWV